MKSCLMAGAMALAYIPMPAIAQTQLPPVKDWSGRTVPGAGTMLVDRSGNPIDPSNPLPSAPVPLTAATSTPLTGTSTGAQTVGPFVPVLGRPITLALAASSWPGGTAQLLRSTDGGVTKLPLTPAGVTIGVYGGVGADSPWVETEAGATFYLSLPAAGITYRVAQ